MLRPMSHFGIWLVYQSNQFINLFLAWKYLKYTLGRESMNEKLHLKIVINGENGLSFDHLDIEKNLISYSKLRDALENILNIPRQAIVSTNKLGKWLISLKFERIIKFGKRDKNVYILIYLHHEIILILY